jgi:hypothetical protein
MADNEPIVLVHKELPDVEYVAVNEDQADVLAASGWKRQSKSAAKAAASKSEEN